MTDDKQSRDLLHLIKLPQAGSQAHQHKMVAHFAAAHDRWNASGRSYSAHQMFEHLVQRQSEAPGKS